MTRGSEPRSDIPREPRTRLVRRLLPRGVRGDTMLGDLVEEWRVRGGTRAATAWYWRQALSLAVRYAWRRDRINQFQFHFSIGQAF